MTVQELSPTVLIVEDDPTIAELIAWALDDAGYGVRVAPTIAEANALFEQEPPDLLVADLLLPDGTGSDLVRSVREHEQASGDEVATVMMSAHPRAGEQAAEAGADACLPKPFDLDVFVDTIEHLLTPVPSR